MVADAEFHNWNGQTHVGITGVTTAGNMYIDNGFLGQTTWATQKYHRKKVKPKKEEELNPGDTKALDDFLSGFMRSAT